MKSDRTHGGRTSHVILPCWTQPLGLLILQRCKGYWSPVCGGTVVYVGEIGMVLDRSFVHHRQ